MRTYLLASAFCLSCFTAPVYACINDYALEKAMLEASQQDALDNYAKQYRTEKQNNALTKETLNDYGVLLIKNGDYGAAIDIFTELEKRFPNISMTAANLGTAYELQGDNHNALMWIKKGVQRDHNEHDGTEWLHVNILEAKLALLDDTNWLATHTVVGLPAATFNTATITRQIASKNTGAAYKKSLRVTDFLGKTYDLNAIEKAIDYQVTERRAFVQPPDAIMADLYHTQALVNYLQYADKSYGYYAMQEADAYAPANAQVYKKIRADSVLLPPQESVSHHPTHPHWLKLTALFFILGGLYMAFRVLKQQRTSSKRQSDS